VAFAELGHVRLFFTDDGAGDPPILFIHGYSCDSHDWMWQLPHFSASHRVVAADLRGHGRSSVPDKDFDPRTFADDLAALMVEVRCGPVVAIGHSLGGVIASVLAVEHPELVVAVVGVDPGYLVPDEYRPVIGAMLDGLPEDPVATAQAFLGATSYTPASPVHLRPWHMRRIAGVPPHVLRDALSALLSGSEALAYCSTVEDYLRRRQCPVLTFFVEPARAGLEVAIFTDPRSRAIVWEGSGHWLHQERPEEFNYVVENWLTSLDSPATV
jgi:pimeloyl-ACP methyl ester carboxylesterase